MYNYQQSIDQWITQEDNWSRLIPYKGAPVYPADLNTIQTILNNQVSSVLSSIYKNGTVVMGSDILIRDTTCEITPGLFYLDGMLIKIPSLIFTIDLLQNYTIYIHIEEERSNVNTSIISSSQKDLLLTPSLGTEVVTISSVIKVDTPSSYVLGNISLGIASTNKTNYLTPLNDLLALSNYERYGNFVVKGLQPTILNNPSTYSISSSLPTSVINAGRFYIKNLEEALRDSIQSQSLIGNQLYISINNFNTTGDTNEGNNISLLKESFESSSKNVTFFKNELKKAYDGLSSESTSLSSNFIKDTINISPGVAYIEGRRINLPTSTSIYIERNLTEQLIDNAKYEITPTDNRIYRSLEINGDYSFDDLLTFYTEVSITIENLSFNDKQGTGKFVCIVNNNLPEYVNSIQLLLDFIIAEIMFKPYNHPNVRFELVSGNIGSSVNVRSAIIKAIDLQRINASTISIASNENNVITFITSTDSLILTWDKNESYVGNNITNNNYTLSFTPVTKIKSLIADMQRVNEPIIRGNSDRDLLPDETVFEIDSVIQNDIRYLLGIDYLLIGTNSIKWLFNTTPSSGSLYYITYKYTQPLLENEDFILSKIDNSITFINQLPTGNSFTIDYFYALSKKGYVYLDSNGQITTQIFNSSEQVLPSLTSSSLTLATFEITPTGINLLPFSVSKIITPESINLLDERIKVLEDDVYTLMSKINSNNNNVNAALIDTNDFINITPNTTDSFAYNILLGGITPRNKGITQFLLHTEGGFQYNDNLFDSSASYISLLRETNNNWDLFGLQDTEFIRLNPVTNSINQPILLTSIDRINILDPLDSLISFLDSYAFTIVKDTYTLGSNVYIDTIYRELVKQVGNFLVSTQDSINYGVFNSLLLTPSYFVNSFIEETKASGILLKVVIINLPFNASGISIQLNGDLVNDRTIPLGNTIKESNNLLTADSNGYLTFQLQLPTLSLGAQIIEVVRSNKIIVSSSITFSPNTLISSINQAFTSWNQFVDINHCALYPINSHTVNNLITVEPDSYISLSTDSLYSSDESLVQFFTPTQDMLIEGISINVKGFDSKVRIIGVLKEALVDNEYQINSYKTVEGAIGLLINKILVDSGEPTKLILTTPTTLYKNNTYALCLYVYNSWVELSSYNLQYPLPDLFLKGCLYRSGSERVAFNSNKNIHISPIFFTFPKNIQQDVYLGTYKLEEDVVTTHFAINTQPILLNGCSLEFQYYDGSSWKGCHPNCIVPLSQAIESLQLKAIYQTNNIFTSPLISLNESSITLFTSYKVMEYTSPNILLEDSTSQIDFLVEYLDDPYITYEIKIGNDLDELWFNVSFVSSSLTNLDSSGLFKQVMYSYQTSSQTSFNSNFVYRIIGTTTNVTRIPCIRKVSIYVHS